jgi:hypothetical protein
VLFCEFFIVKIFVGDVAKKWLLFFFYLFLRFQSKLETQLNIIIVEKNSSSAAAQDRKY